MNIVGDTFQQAIKAHQARDYNGAAMLYNKLLNLNPYDETLLSCLGDLYLRVDHSGLAIHLLSSLLQQNPNDDQAWCNIGIGYRMEQRYEEAIRAWSRAIELRGDSIEVCSNMAGLYSDRAMPDKAIHWIDRALAIDPNMVEARWQRGLARLTLGDWGGWEDYEHRLQLEHFDTRKAIDVPWWDWGATDHLYIHGEQGIGDEVMFLSCLDDVLPLAGRVTVELNQAVIGIARQTWPGVNFIPEPAPGDYTAKVAIGSLPAHLRRSERAFPGVAYLKPDEALVGRYRRQLEALGPGPYVAVTWLGGTKQTRVQDRSMTPKNLKPILDAYTCVSAQYEHTNPYVVKEREEASLPKLDDDCVGKDIHAQAALFKAVDFVVTVQQTAVHVAGAVGAKTFAMIGSHPHWRYGLTGSAMPWYRSVELIRQRDSWDDVISTVEKALASNSQVRRAA